MKVDTSSIRWLSGFLALFVAAGVATFAGVSAVRAAAPAKAAPAKADDEADEDTVSEDTVSEDKAVEDKSDDAADPYAIPDGSPKELMEFIETLKTTQPKITTREELIEHFTKANKAYVAAADKILAAKPDKDLETSALKAKLDALWMLTRLGTDGASADLEKMAAKLKSDKRPEVASNAKFYLVAARLQKLDPSKPEESEELIEDVKSLLSQETVDPKFYGLAGAVGQALEQSGQPQLAAKAYKEIAAVLSESKDPKAAQLVESLEGQARKLELIGSPLEIEGKLVNGDDFDWASYKGKVVLVDFWATWCGPCRAELPNVKATYEKYHDKGFEVVGISLDDANNKEGLEQFLEKEEIPWPILFSTDAEATGWKHPMATRYGINAIPAAVLVDKEGNVVTLSARGEELGKLVAKSLGEDEDAGDKSSDKPDDAKKESKGKSGKASAAKAAKEKPATR